MKVGIMQPYLLPYQGYFNLISACDVFVVFDIVKYIDKGWLNRNRLLHPNTEKQYQYFNVNMKNKSNFDLIKDIRIEAGESFKKNLIGKLSAFKKAPYHSDIVKHLNLWSDITFDYEYLSHFNTKFLELTCEHLNIKTPIINVEEIDFDITKVQHAGSWALEISKALGASEYINPISGQNLFNIDEFESENIKLLFIEPVLSSYPQYREKFIGGLSVIDMLLWCDRFEVSNRIQNDYKILEAKR